ncbi:MAG: HPF/RaiA family ribosome-associated protein [Desulfobacterales bacterium]|nr:HPF/RaiA family ribosome-associated protein [Desulfobacterales bacterium]
MELQIEARNIEMRKTWREKIEQEKVRLHRHHPGLVHHLRTTVEGTKHHKGGGYEFLIVASIPNDTVVVKKRGGQVRPLVTEAFDTLGLQLKELQRKKRQTLKTPEVDRFDTMGQADDTSLGE